MTTKIVLFIIFVLFFISSIYSAQESYDSTFLNIYIKLNQKSASKAIELNTIASSYVPHNEINYLVSSEPHITLYQTSFDNEFIYDGVIEKIKTVMTGRKACTIILSGSKVFGNYLLWDVLPANTCLMSLSNDIINATHEFRDDNQPIPNWILNYSNSTIQSQLMSSFLLYGDPFAFSTYYPSVSIAYDELESLDYLKYAMTFPSTTFISPTVEVSVGGPFDYVDTNDVLASFNFS